MLQPCFHTLRLWSFGVLNVDGHKCGLFVILVEFGNFMLVWCMLRRHVAAPGCGGTREERDFFSVSRMGCSSYWYLMWPVGGITEQAREDWADPVGDWNHLLLIPHPAYFLCREGYVCGPHFYVLSVIQSQFPVPPGSEVSFLCSWQFFSCIRRFPLQGVEC